MAKAKKSNWREMTFTELDYDALIEHALSLGGERSIEAIAFDIDRVLQMSSIVNASFCILKKLI